jgi:hypothetical protein
MIYLQAVHNSDPCGVYVNGTYGEPQQRGVRQIMMHIISINYKPEKRRRNLPKF